MEELLKRLNDMDTKLNDIHVSVEKTRKYFKWTLITSVVFFVLPLIAMLFVLPSFIHNMNAQLEGLL